MVDLIDTPAACTMRTARGMRTPTGDFLTCVGGHSASDGHGSPFGESGWFTWTDVPAADEHGRTKDKLPERPRGPHPYPTAVQ